MQTEILAKKQGRILIVEDDSRWVNIFSDALNEEGYSLEIARDLKSARFNLRSSSPDVVVLDMHLDRRSMYVQGWDLLDEMKSPPYGPCVIVVTEVVNDPDGFSKLTDKHIFRYLPKTRYSGEEFRNTIRRALEEKQGLMSLAFVGLKLRNSDYVNKKLVANNLDELTRTEMRVLNRLVAGDSNKEIAVSLTIGENTVKTHVKNVLDKFQIDKRTKILPLVISLGLVE